MSAALDVTLECQNKPVVLFPAPGETFFLSDIKEGAVLELSLTISATKSGIEKVAISFGVEVKGTGSVPLTGSGCKPVLQSSHFLS